MRESPLSPPVNTLIFNYDTVQNNYVGINMIYYYIVNLYKQFYIIINGFIKARILESDMVIICYKCENNNIMII